MKAGKWNESWHDTFASLREVVQWLCLFYYGRLYVLAPYANIINAFWCAMCVCDRQVFSAESEVTLYWKYVWTTFHLIFNVIPRECSNTRDKQQDINSFTKYVNTFISFTFENKWCMHKMNLERNKYSILSQNTSEPILENSNNCVCPFLYHYFQQQWTCGGQAIPCRQKRYFGVNHSSTCC